MNDDDLTALLGATYQEASRDVRPPAGLATAVRRRHTTAARRRVAVRVGAPAAAVAMVGGAIALVGTSPGAPAQRTPVAGGPAPATQTGQSGQSGQPGTYRLAGYTFTLPRDFKAADGTCQVRLVDGTVHQGTPGADGSCAAVWLTAQRPPWVSPDTVLHEGDIAVTPGHGEVLLAAPVPASHGGGYVTVAANLPDGASLDFRSMIDNAINGSGR